MMDRDIDRIHGLTLLINAPLPIVTVVRDRENRPVLRDGPYLRRQMRVSSLSSTLRAHSDSDRAPKRNLTELRSDNHDLQRVVLTDAKPSAKVLSTQQSALIADDSLATTRANAMFNLRIGIYLLVAALFVSVSSGKLAAQASSGSGVQNRTPVYMFRGFVGYSPGFSQWERRLRERGYEPVVCMSAEWPLIKSEIVERRQSGDRRPVHIFGYSFGGQASVMLCESLQDEGIRVDSLQMLECYLRLNVPSNVRYCMNVYESRRADDYFIFRGVSVRAASKNTRMAQINLARDYPNVARQLHHFDITQNVWVQNLFVSKLPNINRTQAKSDSVSRVASQPSEASKLQ